MATIIIHPESEEQENLFEQLAKALKNPFEKSDESPYNPEFIKKFKKELKIQKMV